MLLSLGMIVFVGAVAAGATGAFFSDTETSTGNTFAAGDIDLLIDNESYVTSTSTGSLVASASTSWTSRDLNKCGPNNDQVCKFFNFTDVKPGDMGEDTISIHVGSNNAWMCAAARVTVNSDENCTEPENQAVGGESGGCVGETNGTNGDLAQALNFKFWKDDGDNVLETDEVAGIFLQGPLSGLGAQGKIALAQPVASGPAAFGSNPIPGNSDFYIGKAWCMGTLTNSAVSQDGLGKQGTPQNNAGGTGVANGPLIRGTGVTCDGTLVDNKAQTDKVVGDMEFYATQSRNNGNFSCTTGYTPTWGD